MTDCYLPRLGGIEVQVRDLAVRLVRAGHDVEVFTTTVGSDGQRHGAVEVLDGVPVHRLAIRLPYQLPWNPMAATDLRRRLRHAADFDVAHVHMGIVSPFTLDCTRVALDHGLPTTMTWHCMLGPAEAPFTWLRAFRAWAARGVAMNAVSSVAAAPVQRVIGDAGTVAVLPNGIDLHRWWRPDPQHRRMPASTQGPLRIISAMRLAPRKRPLALLSVLRRIRDLAPELPVHLTVLGEGRMRGKLERAIEHDGLADRVELAGRVSRSELLERYHASHLYLSPARLESFGIAALEARCVGLPVVGLHTSGAAEFVEDGVNGFLADSDEGMALAVLRLLTDHELRESMFRYNVSTPPAQDWPNVLEATLAEYGRAQSLAGLVPATS